MKKAVFFPIFAFGISPCVEAAGSSDFGPYSYISHEVSASYAQVARDTWTWKFLNNSNTTTITYMAFKFVDKNGSHNAVLPGKLKPGASLGVGKFMANSRPTITITKIKREDSSRTVF